MTRAALPTRLRAVRTATCTIVHKQPIAQRLARIMRRLTLGESDLTIEGPRVVSASVLKTMVSGGEAAPATASKIEVVFRGGTAPFLFCTNAQLHGLLRHAGERFRRFDRRWQFLDLRSQCQGCWRQQVQFSLAHTAAPAAAPALVRYTANSDYPQCALYNAEWLPALPFVVNTTLIR